MTVTKNYKFILLIFSMLFLIVISQRGDSKESDDESAWKEFKSKHKKNYTNPSEEQKRSKIFKQNKKKIDLEREEARKNGYEIG